MDMDLVICGGTIVTETEMFRGDLGVKNGKIAVIAGDLSGVSCEERVDASRMLDLPGAVDAHTHLSFPFGGTVSSDDFFAGTRAAACGGTTTVFDYSGQLAGERLSDTVRRRAAQADSQGPAVDYALHVGITDLSDGLLDSMGEAVDLGVSSFKVYMVYDFGVRDGDFYRVLRKAKETGSLICVHAENDEIITTLQNQFAAEGKLSPWYHYASRPEFVAGEAGRRAVAWARSLNTPLYIVHLSDLEGVKAVTEAKDEGLAIYAETCPQYLHFTCDVFKREDGRNFVCSPPMKGEASREALWQAVRRGASNPARIFGCTSKGSLTVGKDADIVIYDPRKDFTVRQENMHSDCDHTIWEGLQLKGYPVRTYSRGRLVCIDGEFTGQRGWGRMIRRKPRVL